MENHNMYLYIALMTVLGSISYVGFGRESVGPMDDVVLY